MEDELQSLECVALERGYTDRLIEEDTEFTLKDSRRFSPNWMKTKKNDARSKKLVAEAAEFQQASKRGKRDKRIAELEELLRSAGIEEQE